MVTASSIADLAGLGSVMLSARTPREALVRTSPAMPRHSTHEQITVSEVAGGMVVREQLTLQLDQATLHAEQQYVAALIRALCWGTGYSGEPLARVEMLPHPRTGLGDVRLGREAAVLPSRSRALTLFLPDSVLDRPFLPHAATPPPPDWEALRGDRGFAGTARVVVEEMLEDGAPSVERLAAAAGSACGRCSAGWPRTAPAIRRCSTRRAGCGRCATSCIPPRRSAKSPPISAIRTRLRSSARCAAGPTCRRAGCAGRRQGPGTKRQPPLRLRRSLHLDDVDGQHLRVLAAIGRQRLLDLRVGQLLAVGGFRRTGHDGVTGKGSTKAPKLFLQNGSDVAAQRGARRRRWLSLDIAREEERTPGEYRLASQVDQYHGLGRDWTRWMRRFDFAGSRERYER